MATESIEARRPLRLWPGVLAAVLLLTTRFGVPVFLPEQTIYGVIGGFAGAAAIAVWWLLCSLALWVERIGAIVLMVVGLVATWPFVDVSISTGAMGGLLPMLAVPTMTVALVAWAVASRHLSTGSRRATMVATLLLACGAWTLAKTGGFTTSFDNDLMWRWSETRGDRLVAAPSAALPSAAAPAATSAPVDAEAAHPTTATTATPMVGAADAKAEREWPGFRGRDRDGVVHGVQIETDWVKTPPASLWRRPI